MKEQKNEESVVAFKGFDKDWKCRGYQYAVGGTYEHDGKVLRCAAGGFHSCEYPLDVFGYYGPSSSRYAQVIASGDIDRDDEDTKIASGKITVEFELSVPQMVAKAVDWILARVDSTKEANERLSVVSNTGYQSAATNTGDWSAATNTGYQSAATNTGDQSAAEVNGAHCVAAAFGGYSRAKANEGSAIVLVYRDMNASGDDYARIVHIRSAIAGSDGIKPDVWYSLNPDGEFVEAE